ncbi:MAG: hypothetical protein ACLPJY_14005, partial [Rhodomicrobium sp.]
GLWTEAETFFSLASLTNAGHESFASSNCLGWTMGSVQPVLVKGYCALRGCNLALRQWQMVTSRHH